MKKSAIRTIAAIAAAAILLSAFSIISFSDFDGKEIRQKRFEHNMP